MEKIKYVYVSKNGDEIKDLDFTVGKIYEAYPTGKSRIKDDNGFVYNLTVSLFFNLQFEPLENVAFMVECTKSRNGRFIKGEKYFVGIETTIYKQPFKYSLKNLCEEKTISYEEWYNECEWHDCEFKLLVDYTNKDYTDKKEELVNIIFTKISGEVCICENPSDNLLEEGTKIRTPYFPINHYGNNINKVSVIGYWIDSTVISSIKIERKYLPNLINIFCKEVSFKKITGVYEVVQEEKLISFVKEEGEN